MKKIDKGSYLTSWLVGIIGFWVMFSVGMAGAFLQSPLLSVLMLLAYIPLIYAVVMMMVLIYKMWAAIQGSGARTTPGMAVGLKFIPFFNLYWVFQAYWGWAKDYNKMVRERQLAVPVMPEGLALTASILAVVSGIPYLGLLAFIPYLIVMTIFLAKACNGVNALVDAGVEPQEAVSMPPLAGAKTSGMAIWSLVLGILSVIFSCLTALPGLILGIVSLIAISKSGGRLKGKRLAVAGIVVSATFIVMVPLLMAILSLASYTIRLK